MRLFLMIPKTFTDDDLRKDFEKFGPIDYVNIIKDRATGQSKGLAYVKFHKASTAAIALENCDPSYKPKFAEPKYSSSWKERQYQEAADRSHYDRDSYRSGSRDSLQDGRRGVGEGDRGLKRSLPDWNMFGSGRGLVQLNVFTPTSVTPEQLYRLFDIIPGLEYCDQKGNGFAIVKYATPEAATYARQKLHGFEYPPDNKLIVKYSDEFSPDQWQSQSSSSAIQNQLETLTAALSQTTALLKQAGLPVPEGLVPQSGQTFPAAAANRTNDRFVSSYCTAELPSTQPMIEYEMQEAIRLFLIFSPEPPPLSALKDVFCRFGNLMEVYLINNRNVGYAKYATRESGLNAMATLHGHEIMHVKMKVVEADPPEHARKKQKVDSSF